MTDMQRRHLSMHVIATYSLTAKSEQVAAIGTGTAAMTIIITLGYAILWTIFQKLEKLQIRNSHRQILHMQHATS